MTGFSRRVNLLAVGLLWFSLSTFPALPLFAAEIPIAPADSPTKDTTHQVQTPPAQCDLPAPRKAESEFGWELDPYYTNVSLSIPLTNEPIPELTVKDEASIYRHLLKNALFPRFIMLEAAIFPMPLAGVAARNYTPDFYRLFNVGSGDLNLVEAVTAGFQEPYSLSLFFGDLVNFVRPGEEKVCSNKGYMGFMFSYSNQHIKHNMLIPDNNLEAEWKLNGDRVFSGEKLSWSFRLGTKIHENPDISDSLYLGFRRSNLDFGADFLDFLDNSSFDLRWDFAAQDGRPLRQEYVIGKKIPVKKWRVALRMDIGFIWENPTNYSGSLSDTRHQTFSAVIRPNFEF